MRNVGRCTAFRSCRHRAKYDAPSKLCSKHWHMWWRYGETGREDLPYMRRKPTRQQVADAQEWLDLQRVP